MSLRRTRNDSVNAAAALPPEALARLLAIGDDAPTLDERVAIAEMLRTRLGVASGELDRLLLERLTALGESVETVQHAQRELRELLERYRVGPWYPAVFLAHVDGPGAPRALVQQGGGRRVVGVTADVDAARLVAGAEVYLDDERGLVVDVSSLGLPPSAETASFERALGRGRVLLRWRDELVVATAAAALPLDTLVAGDLVRWDHGMGMAFERLERQADCRFLLEDVPHVGPECIGGQDENLARLRDALTIRLLDPARARRYGLDGRRSVLMVGPPGGGKTLLARIATAEIDRMTGKRCRLAIVKPAEFQSMWVGESERAVRECFRTLREAARDGHAVLFLDEVESVGRIRGASGGRHGDDLLAALLAELDGFEDRAGVAIIAATNRKDLIDGALLERLSDVEIHVGRPTLAGARRIFEIHLPATVPFAENEGGRDGFIDRAVSRLYSPNGDNQVSVLRFRNGTTRPVAARDLLSGRAIAQMCRDAREAALAHDVRAGEVGVTWGDVDDAVSAGLDKLATTLTPTNCRAHLGDLPPDLEVVGVERVWRPATRRHAYVRAA